MQSQEGMGLAALDLCWAGEEVCNNSIPMVELCLLLSIAGIRGPTVVSSRRERRKKNHEAFLTISEDEYCK